MEGNEHALRIVKTAFGVILVVGLISLSIYQYVTSTQAVKNNNAALVDSSVEWTTADLDALASTDRTGTEVLNAVRKYKNSYTVKVETAASATGGKIYNASTYVSNSKDSPDYVNPESLFTCSLVMNANGVITEIDFKEKLQTSESDASIETPEQAKSYLVDNISGGLISRNDSWGEIAKKLNNSTDQSAKRVLASAVGGDTADSWADLANDASTAIKDLKSEVSKQNANASIQHKRGSLHQGASVDLGMTPKMIIVWRSTDNEMQMYSGTSWTTRNEGSLFTSQWCTLSGSTLTNVSSESADLQYEAFSY